MTDDLNHAEGTLLVPIANRETADRQLDTAIDIARDRSYGILVTFVLSVPPQLSLQDGRRYLLADEDEELVADAKERVEAAGIQVETRIQIGRGVARTIINLTETDAIDAVLLGWRGRPPRKDVVLGSHIDRILRDAPCDVLVKRIQEPTPPIESVLVAVAGGPHNEYAAETAAAIARANDASVHLLYVYPPDEPERSRTDARQLLADRASAFEGVSSVDRELVERSHVAGTITDRTAAHDMTFLGASRGGLVQRVLLGSVSESVGRHAAGPVIIARRHDPVPSRLRRLFSR